MDSIPDRDRTTILGPGADLYGVLFRCSSDGLILLEKDTGVIIEANAAAALMAGRAPEELRRVHLIDLVVSHAAGEIDRALAVAREAGSSSLDVSLAGRGGSTPRAVTVHIETLAEGTLVLLRDVSEESMMLEMVRRERQMSRGLLETVNACVLGLDARGRTTLFNPCFRATSGIQASEILGRDAIDLLISEEDRLRARRALAALMAGETVQELELRIVSGRLISFNGSRLIDSDDQPYGTVWIGLDVTGARSLLEQARRDEERTQRNLQQLKEFSRVSSMILQEKELDRVCRMFVETIRDISTFNRAILTLCDDEFRGYQWYFAGLSEREIAAFHQNKMTSKERVTIFQERFRLGNSYYIPHDEGWYYEGVPSNRSSDKMKDWHPDDFLFIPLFGTNRKIVGIVSVDDPADGLRPTAENISPLELFANQVAHAIEEKKLDQQVRKTTRRYQTLVQTMNDGLFTVDLSEKITFVNPALAALIGTSEQEIVDRDLSFLMPPASVKRFSRRTRLHEGGAVSRFELSLRDKEGREIPVRVSATPYMQDNAMVGSFAIVSDLREQRKAEEDRLRMHEEVLATNVKLRESMTKLKAAQEQLIQAEKLSALGELISGVTHELNNPLTGIMGYSQLLMADTSVGAPIKKSVERINKEAVRCQKIVENLLAFARRHRPERKPVDVNAVITSSLELREYQLKVEGIEIETRLAADMQPVLGDAYQIQQVFVNIINNAFHAMSETDREKRLIVRSRQYGERIRVEFTDTGPGIPSDKIAKIFDPFFTTKEIGKGTGLGLSLSYGIIKEHEGNIRAESVPGAGATFIVDLPANGHVKGETAENPETHTARREPVEQGKRILVVDDEETILELLTAFLEGSGHVIETASNGRLALEKVRQADYDIIISDLKMPDMGGQKLYESIREMKPGLIARMIFSTGDTVNPTTQAFFQETGNPYLTKPFKLEDVDRLIAEVLSAG